MLYTCKYCKKSYEDMKEAEACEAAHEAEELEAKRKADEKQARMDEVRACKQAYIEKLQALYRDYPEENPNARVQSRAVNVSNAGRNRGAGNMSRPRVVILPNPFFPL